MNGLDLTELHKKLKTLQIERQNEEKRELPEVYNLKSE